MTNQINEKINEEILRAKVKYGAVDLSSVLNKIIGVFPEVKNNIEDIVKEIQKEIKNSEKISKDEAEKILGEKGLNISKPKEENKELKLEGDTSNVVMRLAPNPSGPLHIGHARMIALNDFFVQKYKGKLICRIEDTDPERIYHPAYELVLEDVKNFNIKYDELIIQSDRWEIYYKMCEQLILEGKAYVCTCSSEKFSELKTKDKHCGCRARTIEENLSLFHNHDKIDEIEVVTETTYVVAQESNISSEKLDVVAQESNISSEKLDVVAQESNISSEKLDVVAQKSNISSEKLDVVAQKSNISSEKLDVVAERQHVVVPETTYVVAERQHVVVPETTYVVAERQHVVVPETTYVVAERQHAVVRFKTPKINNPALREFPLMRLKKDPEHCRKQNPYKWYPMMNFSVTIDDHILCVTHVLRGTDHLTNTDVQKIIYDALGWSPPIFMLYGLLMIEEGKLSKSEMIKSIEAGKYSGFDDPQLWTLRSLFRRGIQQQAIKNYLISLGITKNNITFDEKALFKENIAIVEPLCTHLFFVETPTKLEIEDYSGPRTIEIPANLKNPNKGTRSLKMVENPHILIAKKDFKKIKDSEIFRLKDGFNVHKEKDKLVFENVHLTNIDAEMKLNKIHWLPESDENINCEILMTDGTTKLGLVEPFASKLAVGDMVQFERVGYARVDKIEPKKIVAVFAH